MSKKTINIEVIIKKHINLMDDSVYKELFSSYKKVNEIWNKNQYKRKVILIPGYDKAKKSKKGSIFETIVLNEIINYHKEKNIKCEYIGQRTDKHGFDIVLFLNDKEIWFVECKYNTNSLKKAFKESLKSFLPENDQFSNAQNIELNQIIEYLKSLDIENTRKRSKDQREKIINAGFVNIKSWKDIENFISGTGSENNDLWDETETYIFENNLKSDEKIKKKLFEEIKNSKIKNLKIVSLFLKINDDILEKIINNLEESTR